MREIVVKETVNKDVARRKNWAKFGAEEHAAPGPDYRTTQIGDAVYLRLGTSWKAQEKEEEEKKAVEASKTATKTITCRTCGGAHFTSKCPFKDTLGADEAAEPVPGADSSALGGAGGAGKSGYIPPHMRNRVPGTELPERDREETPTLKFLDLNTNVTEDMLQDDLLRHFGHVVRVNVVRNRETGKSKGLAFAQFAHEYDAQRAMDALNGRGYRNLILRVEWSKPKK